eukprot:365656-Chlamydomonas_euryale.AAC.9
MGSRGMMRDVAPAEGGAEAGRRDKAQKTRRGTFIGGGKAWEALEVWEEWELCGEGGGGQRPSTPHLVLMPHFSNRQAATPADSLPLPPYHVPGLRAPTPLSACRPPPPLSKPHLPAPHFHTPAGRRRVAGGCRSQHRRAGGAGNSSSSCRTGVRRSIGGS